MVEVLKCLSSVLSMCSLACLLYLSAEASCLLTLGAVRASKCNVRSLGVLVATTHLFFGVGVTPYEGCSWQVYPTGSLEWTSGPAVS